MGRQRRAVRDHVGELTAPGVRLADVGGMDDVKRRLELSFLAPLRNPEMRAQFGKSLRGGLLLWGPPGCGKTFIARALAGELGASFYEVGLSDVLDMWIGSSERNLHAIFDTARRNRPCVLFFDEIDAIGQKRTQLHGGGGAMRGVVNQFLPSSTAPAPTTRACSCWPRPTTRGTSTPRSLRPGGSTGCCWCCRPTPRPARRSSASTCAASRPRRSTSAASSRRPTGCRAPTWR